MPDITHAENIFAVVYTGFEVERAAGKLLVGSRGDLVQNTKCCEGPNGIWPKSHSGTNFAIFCLCELRGLLIVEH